MIPKTPQATARIAGHPIHVMLVPIPVVCFVGTLVTDIAYWLTANMQWANFSAWILSVGLIASTLGAVAGLIDFLGDRGIRRLRPAWIHAAGNAVALLCTPEAGWITGQTIHADGGTSLMNSDFPLPIQGL